MIGTSTSSTNKFIHINSRLSDIDKFYTCAHELGYAIFHYKSNVLFLEKNTLLSTNKYEIETYTFAAELLIDDNLLNGDESNIATADYFDYWYKEYVLINCKYNTQEYYKRIIKNHIKLYYKSL